MESKITIKEESDDEENKLEADATDVDIRKSVKKNKKQSHKTHPKLADIIGMIGVKFNV